MKRKICVVTGSRADYGLLRLVMKGIKEEPQLTLQVIATGMHLSATYGLTYKEIEKDGFQIDFKVEILTSGDSALRIAESMAAGLTGCAKAFDELKPDIIVVLGDRFEIFAATAAALVAKIPVAHIHGGETTFGSFDEAFRHSITKMSHLHLVATQEYRQRVIQLGENPKNVFLVGGLGVDSVNEVELLSKEELESSLGIVFQRKSLLITFHPVTLEVDTAETQMKELLAALSELKETTLIFTMPNADTGGLAIIELIQEFVSHNRYAYSFISLGQQRYLSCVALVDGVVGNSSSGLIEAPSFRKGTINIGARQGGRLQASSVINCEPEKLQIRNALKKLYNQEFTNSLPLTSNPYGEGGSTNKIIDVLRDAALDGIIQKTFYDIQ
jgi:GDP/UDP-N,N'-diacetylbacillosamine 2-epimerase (hydrolysing)